MKKNVTKKIVYSAAATAVFAGSAVSGVNAIANADDDIKQFDKNTVVNGEFVEDKEVHSYADQTTQPPAPPTPNFEDEEGYVDWNEWRKNGYEPGNGARDWYFGSFYFGPAGVEVATYQDILEGGVNVQAVGNYSKQEGDYANDKNTAQVMWDVQWSPVYAPGDHGDWLEHYPYMLNETDIFVPKAVKDIHLTLGQAQSLGDSEKSAEQLLEYLENDNYYSWKPNITRNDVREMIELRPDKGGVDFNSFYQDDNGNWKRLYAGDGSKEKRTAQNMLDVGSFAYVQEDLTKLPEGVNLPEGIDKSNLSEYKMIRIASDKKGMHTVRVSGTINVNGAKSDVYVPLRATNRLRYVDFDRKIVDRVGKEFTDPQTGKTKTADWINPGPLPEFSITDPEVNKRNAEIYAKPINTIAGFDTTEKCKPVTNTYEEGSSIINTAGLEKINDDEVDPKLLIGQSSERINDIFAVDGVLTQNDGDYDKSRKYLEYDAENNIATYKYDEDIDDGNGWKRRNKWRFDIPDFVNSYSLKNDSCDQAALRIKLREQPTPEEEPAPSPSESPTPSPDPSPSESPTPSPSESATPSPSEEPTPEPSGTPKTDTSTPPVIPTPDPKGTENVPTTTEKTTEPGARIIENKTEPKPVPPVVNHTFPEKQPVPQNPSRVNTPPFVPAQPAAIPGPVSQHGPVVNTGGAVHESFWTKIANIFR
ncbi:hypothetical protein QP999_12695 [Corynebacterium sp. MSK004]|uniref:hypothetical protein n=1 Tax=Corynebacterium sp. MSK004 TaxID=3050186 RepID=UPI00254DD338|nr:hypothetical protein [Corynebacterium sp. MSK004]MDK8898781.1 hypothetical protein [Corynebacterium sp. MSK004]